jgi:hypothetical protein
MGLVAKVWGPELEWKARYSCSHPQEMNWPKSGYPRQLFCLGKVRKGDWI